MIEAGTLTKRMRRHFSVEHDVKDKRRFSGMQTCKSNIARSSGSGLVVGKRKGREKLAGRIEKGSME